MTVSIWGLPWKEQASRARTSNYISQYLWDGGHLINVGYERFQWSKTLLYMQNHAANIFYFDMHYGSHLNVIE